MICKASQMDFGMPIEHIDYVLIPHQLQIYICTYVRMSVHVLYICKDRSTYVYTYIIALSYTVE